MAKKKIEFDLPTLDDLFSSQEERDEQKLAKIREIPIELIDDFPDHPYHVREDEDMLQLIESVKEREAARTEPKKEMKQLYESLIPNTLYKHIEKETLYVQFATIPEGGHTNTEWLIDGKPATIDEVKESGYVINSYWNSKGEAPEIQKIKLENVISIGG